MGGALCAVCGRRELVFFELARCPHSFFFNPENMAEEEVAKPVVGNDSGTCKASLLVTCQECVH